MRGTKVCKSPTPTCYSREGDEFSAVRALGLKPLIQAPKRLVMLCQRDDKAVFATRSAALKHMRRLREAGHYYAADLRPYRCVAHRVFHLGRTLW